MIIRETLITICMMIILTNVIAGPIDAYNISGTITMPNITMAPDSSYSELWSNPAIEITQDEYLLLYLVIAVYVGLLLFLIKLLFFSKEK